MEKILRSTRPVLGVRLAVRPSSWTVTPCLRSCSSSSSGQDASVALRASEGGVTSTASGDPKMQDAREIFRCHGIEWAALQMRRRVQLGLAVHVFGMQASNYVYHSAWNDLVVAWESHYFENSTALLVVFIMVMWNAQGFIRDAMLARHVTGIAVYSPPCGNKVLWVSTGPWVRRLELEVGVPNKVHGESVAPPRFGKFFRLGLLHTDRSLGEVVDHDELNELQNTHLVVGKEEISTDIARAKYAFVSDGLLPFLNESGVSSLEGSEMNHIEKQLEWLNRSCNVNGARVMRFVGNASLAMGISTILIWFGPKKWR
mmetsp:Transcript_53445/g.98852  ORF Transcript_53445/g.98852 Transcript_53445/m.98852 type:complete len:315 (+) Transcript_53445:52-996(+)